MAEIEVEIKSEGKGCDGNCACGGEMKPMEPKKTKDQLIADLKVLLSKSDANGQAERQVQIDELMAKIAEYGKEED